MNAYGQHILSRRGLLSVVVLFLVATVAVASASAADKVVPSLDLVPADAAFYSSSLRNGEQWQAMVNSKAWAKLKALPYVQMGLGLYGIQAGDPTSVPGQIEAAQRDPKIQRSLKLLGEMFSDEVFLFAGPNFNDMLQLFQSTFGTMRYGPAIAQLSGETKGMKDDEVQARMMMQSLVDSLPLLKAPEFVLGFKIKDKALAKEQLDNLEKILTKALAGAPQPFHDRLKRVSIDGSSYLSYTLDGQMVPWDHDNIEKIRAAAAKPADADRLIEHLKSMELKFTLGLRDDFVLLCVGPSTDLLAHLGKGPGLRSLPELAPVKKFADKRLFNVSYMSKATNRHLNTTKADIDNAFKEFKQALPKLKIPEKARDEIDKDSADLAHDLGRAIVPEVGAQLAVGFLTDTGSESYFYDWTEHPEIDASKPLDLLKHIGGSPLAAIVNRTKVSPDAYDLLAKWIGVAYRYAEEYGVPQMKEKERKQYDTFMGKAKPLFQRLSTATRDSLIPALADGQTAIVLDTKLTSKQFIKQLPPTEQSLPMFEPALVFAVSDVEKLKIAFGEYWAVADEFLEIVRNTEGSKVPADFKIPRPKTYKLKAGTMYSFQLPEEWGVDKKVLPNAALTDHVAVLSLSGKHSIRLLAETQPSIGSQKLPLDRPLASAGGFDFAGMIDAYTPWIDMGIDLSTKQVDPSVAENIRQHAHAVIEVLKVYRSTVEESFVEGKAVVTHATSEVRDIDENAAKGAASP